MAKSKKKRSKPGPQPEQVKVRGNWERAVKKALKKKRPPDGWPKESGPVDNSK